MRRRPSTRTPIAPDRPWRSDDGERVGPGEAELCGGCPDALAGGLGDGTLAAEDEGGRRHRHPGALGDIAERRTGLTSGNHGRHAIETFRVESIRSVSRPTIDRSSDRRRGGRPHGLRAARPCPRRPSSLRGLFHVRRQRSAGHHRPRGPHRRLRGLRHQRGGLRGVRLAGPGHQARARALGRSARADPARGLPRLRHRAAAVGLDRPPPRRRPHPDGRRDHPERRPRRGGDRRRRRGQPGGRHGRPRARRLRHRRLRRGDEPRGRRGRALPRPRDHAALPCRLQRRHGRQRAHRGRPVVPARARRRAPPRRRRAAPAS